MYIHYKTCKIQINDSKLKKKEKKNVCRQKVQSRQNGNSLNVQSRRNGSRPNGNRPNGSRRNGSRRNGNKLLPLDDLDLFYGKVNIGRPCI